MTDPLAPAIEPIREKFVQAYAQWLPEMLKLFPQGVSEHPFAIRHDKSLIRNLYRIDFATQLQPKPEFREFRLSDMLAFRSWDGPIDGVHIHLHPFRWDAVVIQLQGAKWNVEAVTRWFDRWFGLMKDTPVVTPGIQTSGFIHAASLQDQSERALEIEPDISAASGDEAVADLVGLGPVTVLLDHRPQLGW